MAVLAGTGHRPSRLGNEYSMRGPISNHIKSCIRKIFEQEQPTSIISGMALGFDTILAMYALENNIPVTAAVPFRGQEDKWLPKSQHLYKQILADPNVTVREICDPGYSIEKMFIRDRWMIDNCDKVVACWDGQKFGGTYKTILYAKNLNKPILMINPLEFEC
jgi:uncharacterized phage-like protein YoqJ